MKKLIIMFMATMLVTLSCHKEYQGTKQDSLSVKPGSVLSDKTSTAFGPGTIMYKAPESYLREQISKNVNKMIAEVTAMKSGNINTGQQKGVTPDFPSTECATMMNSTSILGSVFVLSGDFCSGTAIVEVTFVWNILENNLDGTLPMPTYNFTVTPNVFPSITLTGTATLISSTPVDFGYGTQLGWDREFSVTADMPQWQYLALTTNNEVTAITTCRKDLSLSNTCSLDYPCSFYTGNPARIYVFNGTGQFGIYDDCTVCPNGAPPHITCSDSGLFEYSPDGLNWTSINLPGGYGTHSASMGNYFYRCTLTYNGCGNSQQKTGTFTVL